MSLVTGLFFLVLLLNQRWSPPLRLQVSHCSTFRIMCDFPSIAVFCSESIECFPGTVSKFFLKLLVIIIIIIIIISELVLWGAGPVSSRRYKKILFFGIKLNPSIRSCLWNVSLEPRRLQPLPPICTIIWEWLLVSGAENLFTTMSQICM